jgi:hypothetical protein
MGAVNRVPEPHEASIGALKAGIGYGLGSSSGAVDNGAYRGGLEFPEGRCASLVGRGVGLVERWSHLLRLLRAVLSAARLTQTPREGKAKPGMGASLTLAALSSRSA